MCKRLFLSKIYKHGSNAYWQLSMSGYSKLLRPIEFLSLKAELKLLLIKFCDKITFSSLLVKILISHSLFFLKPQNMGQMHMSNYL